MTSPMQIGLHLMGGCRIGSDVRQSVVNEHFQVHGMKNLYIADSSVFPNAPGINPMLSIMALAHRASQSLLAEFGQQMPASQSKAAHTKENVQ
jgi:choline dehydrogenase-like flavoprotein